MSTNSEQFIFRREYWNGDSRDGIMVNGDGYHFFKMEPKGKIIEAYEIYEREDGEEIVTPLPEMHNVNWIDDLGFDDLNEVLDSVEEYEFLRVKDILEKGQEC